MVLANLDYPHQAPTKRGQVAKNCDKRSLEICILVFRRGVTPALGSRADLEVAEGVHIVLDTIVAEKLSLQGEVHRSTGGRERQSLERVILVLSRCCTSSSRAFE